MKENFKNEKSGFLKLIILIVIALFLIKYFKINLSDVIDWIKNLISYIFK
jgi:hypothetical protein